MNDWFDDGRDTSCPDCGSDTGGELTCHTWRMRGIDGNLHWMTCVGCASAVRFYCTECGWDYVWGLNDESPDFFKNERKRPVWCDGECPL